MGGWSEKFCREVIIPRRVGVGEGDWGEEEPPRAKHYCKENLSHECGGVRMREARWQADHRLYRHYQPGKQFCTFHVKSP